MAYYVSSGQASNGIVLTVDYMYVSSGGTANSTTVNSRGSMSVSSGGTVNNTTVNRYGSIYVSCGGMANNTTVNSYGSMYVFSGGTATAIVENGGYVDVADGANVTFTPNTLSAGQSTSAVTSCPKAVRRSSTAKMRDTRRR